MHELLADCVPAPLQAALPERLTEIQHRALSSAADKLDELTATTIHAFCQTIICSYAVEADIDPGARILDATQRAPLELFFYPSARAGRNENPPRLAVCRRGVRNGIP